MMVPLLLNSASPLSLVLFRTQQQDRFSRIPLWAWILILFVIVIIVGIIITLREEEEAAEGQVVPQPTPPAPKTPQPTSIPKVVEATARAAVVEAEPPLAVEAKAEVADEAAPPISAKAPAPRPDNLKRIRGIGPKIERFLKENGITTFAELADTEADRLKALLLEAGWENLADPTDWPEQARKLALEK
jgi:predicted flap endonuclease-1-like 5' DNA nuclease